MTLPTSYTNAAEYFAESLELFSDYQNLFKFPNTDLLLENVLEEIPASIEGLNVNDNHFDLRKVSDEYFVNFFARLDRVTPKYEEFEDDDKLEFLMDVPLSPKKKHEIVYLANEISKTCQRTHCNTVVDFGSGLGYLDQQLFETTQCNVLGLECNENHYVGAKKRQRKYHSDSIEKVKYTKHTVTEQSMDKLTTLLSDKFPHSKGFCIAGLHACADLSVVAMNIFLSMAEAQSLVIMPCCYHRLESQDGTFKNFPLSNCLKGAYADIGDSTFMQVPFLRLATQPQILTENKMEDLVFNLLARAVLQLYGFKRNCKLKRKKRKAIRIKTLDNNFKAYVKDVSAGFSLIPINETNITDNEEKINPDELDSIWRQITNLTFKRAAIFILLQNYLQPAFENIILYDRLCYLKENGINNCIYKKILNSKISPRCLSLIAYKEIQYNFK